MHLISCLLPKSHFFISQILIHVIGVIGASCHFGESLESTTRSRCMLLLDSLEMANPRRLKPKIRRFVLDIYRTGDRPEAKHLISRIPFLVPKVIITLSIIFISSVTKY
ncbi:hypothetical protein GLYMA_06G172800v4 [Glycine max]|nr:hypothetical protein GLYMA_06G172800v4 [Glycine max]